MFSEYEIQCFLNNSNYPSDLKLRIRSNQNAVVTNIVVISKVGIKKVDCT